MLFKSRLVPVFLFTVLAVLAGCEERIEPDPVRTKFQLITPNDGAVVTDISEAKIKIKYSNNLKLSGSIMITLNATDITDRFGINNVSDVAIVRMVDVRNTLIQGENELIVSEVKVDGEGVRILDINDQPIIVYQKIFHFFLDNVAPRITVDSVVSTIPNGDGSPGAGSTITVTGSMIDISAIASLNFTHSGGTQALTETTNVPGANQFNNTSKIYSVNLPNYPNTGVPTTTPHFSYTITDIYGNTRTEHFMASGTAIARQKALQVNDPLFLNVTPLLNGMIVNAFNLLDNSSTNFFGVGAPVFDDIADQFDSANPGVLGDPRAPLPGERMKNPRAYHTYIPPLNIVTGTTGSGCVYPSPTIESVEECRPSAYDGVHVYIFPAESAQCSGLLFNPGAGVTDCIVYIKNIDINTPAVDIEFDEKKNQLLANLSLWFNAVNVDVEIAGIRNDGPPVFGQPDSYTYLGGMKGRITLSRFTIETDIRVYPDNTYKMGFVRTTPFHLELTDLLKVPTVTGSCDICSQYVSGWAFLLLALGTDFNDNDIKDKKELISMMGDAIEDKLGPLVDDALGAALKPQAANNDVNGKQTISTSGVVDAYAVYNNNPHFVLNGRDYVSPAFYTPEYAPVNGGLGSAFAVQGDYYKNLMPFIPGWGITLNGVKNLIDVSFAIPSNAINQWLLAQHQAGMFVERPVDFTIAGGDLLRLTFDTNEAPSVHFTSKDTKAGQVCVLGKCITKGPTEGAIKLVVNNLDIELFNVTDAVTMLDATNVDVELEVYVSADGGLPKITLKDSSVIVKVNSDPAEPIVSKAELATRIADGIEEYMNSPSFQASIGSRTEVVNISQLPGIGGSKSSPAATTCDNTASLPGTLCMNGMEVPYASVMVGQSTLLPSDIGMLFRWLTIERDGSYLSVGLDFRNKIGSAWTAEERAANFITWQIRN